MNKHRFLLILLALVLVLSTPLLVLAQEGGGEEEEDPLICDAFVGASDDVRTSYYMGEGAGYAASGQLTLAIDSYSCIIEQIDAGYVPAYMRRAAVFAQRRNYEDATADYTSAVGLDSGLVAAYNNRAIVYAAQEEYELSLADFDSALNLDSGFTAGYSNRAVVRTVVGDFENAIADLEQAIALSGIEAVVAELSDPDRPDDAEHPVYDLAGAQAYALLGIVYSARALDNYNRYLLVTGSQGDGRIQSAAGALESRLTFELRLDDSSWLLFATLAQ